MAAQPDALRKISDDRIAFLQGESDRFAAALGTVSEELRAELVDLLANLTPANAARAQALVDLQRELQGQLNRSGFDGLVADFISGYDRAQRFALLTLKVMRIEPARVAPLDQSALLALRRADYSFLIGQSQQTIQAVATGVVQSSVMGAPRSRIIDNIAATLVQFRDRAVTYADTGLVSYDRRASMAEWRAAGITRFLYRGPADIKNRVFCEHHVGKVYTLDEIAGLDAELAQYSAKPLLPCLYYGGGWNCRHVWTPALDTPAVAQPAAAGPEPPRARLGDLATHAERLAAARIPADLVLPAYDSEGKRIGFRVSGSTKIYANSGSAGKEAKRILYAARPELRPNGGPSPKPPPPPPPPPPPKPGPVGRLGPDATHEERLAAARIPADLIDKVRDSSGKLVGYRVSGSSTVYASGGAAAKVARRVLHQARPDLEREYNAKKAVTPPAVKPPGPSPQARPPGGTPARPKALTGPQVRKALVAHIGAASDAFEAVDRQYFEAVRRSNNATATPAERFAAGKAAASLKAQRRTLSQVLDTHGREFLYAPEAATPLATVHYPAFDYDGSTKLPAERAARVKKTWDEGVEGFARLVGGGHVEGQHFSLKIAPPPPGKRAASYYDNDGGVRMRLEADAQVVVHELGHWFEDMNPAFREKMQAFLVRRTTDRNGERDGLERLNTLSSAIGGGPGYDDSELTRKDKFRHAYVGKDYFSARRYTVARGWENNVVYATEVGSMGLQQMFENPLKFAREDPDYFDTVWEAIRP